jgi:NADPH-dependent curcumin reductase CurA
MAIRNRQVLLASRPSGEPTLENFKLVESGAPTPAAGQMLLRTIYLSLDPYMRGRMSAGESYVAPFAEGAVLGGGAVCEVVESNLPGHKPGELVAAMPGWQEYSLSDGDGVQPIDAAQAPISYYLGVLGMPGLTAYTGLLNIGRPQAGETLVVAAATGAVGSVVGQIGRIKGCRVVGIAGGAEKCRYAVEELGFDECVDHRAPELPSRLKAACPAGIDVYFENVGGAVFEAVLPLLNRSARMPVCGLVAHYNETELPAGPNRVPLFMRTVLVKRLLVQGFLVHDFVAQRDDFLKDVGRWVAEGKIKYREDVTDGLENAPRELIGLLRGENFGKKVIRVGSEPAG